MKQSPILNFKQELTAVFGQPVAENPTQAMVEAAYRHHNLDWRYLTIEVSPDDLADAVRGATAMGFRGFNCTIPHKLAIIPLLDELGESAAVMGAVNCVVRREDKWIGENTDGKGFLESLRTLRDPAGQRVVILGAGGAARAIAVELALAGAAHITLVNRTPERGATLAELIRSQTPATAEFVPLQGPYSLPEATDIFVNATNIGLFPDVQAQLPIDFDSLRTGQIVADVIPNPPQTHLLRTAAARGCHTLDGLGMLVNQGKIGIEYWTGIHPDTAVMHAALTELFG